MNDITDLGQKASEGDIQAKPKKILSAEHKRKLQAARAASQQRRKLEREVRAPIGAPGKSDQVRDEVDRPSRPTRKHFGTPGLKLDAPTRQNYHRCWMNDDGQNIANALECGYTFVQALGGQSKSNETGSKERRLVGKQEGGQALYAYLMEIPNDWYAESQAELEKQNARIHMAIKGGNIQGRVGEDGRYIPSVGIKIREKDQP